MEVSGQLENHAASPRGKSSHYQLVRRLGGPQGMSGLDGGKILLLAEIESRLLGRPARNLIVKPTELYFIHMSL
jgi:hypothetical protein